MSKGLEFGFLEEGELGVIRLMEGGRIQQIALTQDQSYLLQLFIATINMKEPVLAMGEEDDLILKSQASGECNKKHCACK